ncbi:MAG TPA: 30S ribosome-binding factor RbfA [Thermoanaerobaculia bacterium]|nr:30S ribosome-binding factor RbfA [Thermoanaerobaculia bacterium]
MKKTRRSSQVGDVVRTELSSIIRRELDDPEMRLMTITDVEITTDLRYARVFVSTLGDESGRDKVVQSLQKARGRLRHLLGQKGILKLTPELEFKADTTAIRAGSIEKILGEVLPKTAEAIGEPSRDAAIAETNDSKRNKETNDDDEPE